MDSGLSEGSEARFAAYVEALGAALGHADRQEPMRDYCLGLLMPIERKSVEPMAAVTAPARSINPCCILWAMHHGRTLRCWPGWASSRCRRSSVAGGSKPGSSMTRAFPRRGGIRLG